MPIALDTTPAALIRPGSSELRQVVAQHAAGTPYALSAPVVLELTYGMERKRGEAGWDRQREFLRWLLEDGLLVTLPFDRRAAAVAGRLRAIGPLPPTSTSSKTSKRSKSDSRVAWVMDLQTAACVFVAGASLASDDKHHEDIAQWLMDWTGKASHPVLPAPW